MAGQSREAFESVVIESKDDLGRPIKITRKIVKKLVSHEVDEAIARRRTWKKFGLSEDDAPGPNLKTTVLGDELALRLTAKPDFDQEAAATDPILKAPGATGSITCRHCKGPHFSVKCPFKDILGIKMASEGDLGAASAAADAGSLKDKESLKKGAYVPPSLRDKMGSEPTRDDSATVRVTNLSEDVLDQDLRDLFNNIALVTRVFVSRDRYTGRGKGFAYVTLASPEGAAKCVAKLNGYGYDNLILRVEMAAPQNK